MITTLLLNLLLVALFVLAAAAVGVVYVGLALARRSPWVRHELDAVLRDLLGR